MVLGGVSLPLRLLLLCRGRLLPVLLLLLLLLLNAVWLTWLLQVRGCLRRLPLCWGGTRRQATAGSIANPAVHGLPLLPLMRMRCSCCCCNCRRKRREGTAARRSAAGG